MSSKVEVCCALCGTAFELVAWRFRMKVRARPGNTLFFCSRRCAVVHRNKNPDHPGHQSCKITYQCKFCGEDFTTATGATYCSHSCAARATTRGVPRKPTGRVPAESLLAREGWRYKVLAGALEAVDEDFKFEFTVGQGSFDLCLTRRRLLVEFDEPKHADKACQRRDRTKELDALHFGWSVLRLSAISGSIIDPDPLFRILGMERSEIPEVSELSSQAQVVRLC